jgi:hypothetical protein
MYKAKLIESVPTSPGCWNYSQIGIFKGDEQVGEYKRNYPSYGEATFCPFIGADGNWYALYSEHYTATSLMSLPDCKKIGGEEPVGHGFCPTGFYVARYTDYIWKATPESELHKYPEANHHWLKVDRHERDYEDSPEWESELNAHETDSAIYSGKVSYDLRLGFVMGCIWGDDCSWKLERLDLTEAHKGILKREASFGYLELPALPLKECLRISGDDKYFNVAVTSVKHFYMRDGVIKGEED